MKNVKKFAGLLLALLMVMGMTTTAFAHAPVFGVNLDSHTFTAYQVFTGREENGVLSDIQWGDGIDSTAFLAALKADPTYGALFAACTTAAQVAEVLDDNNNNTALAEKVAKIAEDNKSGAGTVLSSGENDLPEGYYLIVDTTADVGEGDAYNAALLKVVGEVILTIKTDAPNVEKKVKEDDKYNTNDGYGLGYNDVADYNIGEAVPFTLIGYVPDMTYYETYKYIFHDTMSAGLTPPAASSIKVYLSADKAVGAGDSDITSSFNVDVTGQVITVSSDNIKNIPGIAMDMYIIVAYSAVLNENAEIGLDGNENTVYLEYSNKPDQSGAGDTGNTGQTPEDKVIVFTYELDATKVDGKNTSTKLQGAQFVLLNADGSQVATVADGKFTGWQNTPTLNPDGIMEWPAGSILTSAADTGLFSVAGLDDGTYRLREIAAPAGYNLLTADIIVVITATTANGQDWTDGLADSALTNLAVTADGVAGTASTATGIAAITIANNSGSTLPETGGIGTALFYIAGAVLVLAAVVLLVTKKRMRYAEN